MIPHEIQDAMIRFGVWERFRTEAQQWPSFEAAQAGLSAIKEEAERIYKALALKAHPDHGGDVELMQELNAHIANLRKLQVGVPQPVSFIHITVSSWSPISATTATTTGTAYGW